MLWFLRRCGALLGVLAYHAGVRKRVTLENLEHAFPEWPPKVVRAFARKCYASLGVVFCELLYLRFAPKRSIERGLEIVNLTESLPIVRRGAGAILLSGHIANWEWLALGCALRMKQPIDVVIKNQTTPRVERFLRHMRTRFGNRMLDAGNARAIFRALRNGECLAVLGDQTGTPNDVRVPFFGREVPSFEGTARLALATRAPILFLEPYERTSRGYRARFHAVPFEDLAGPTPEAIRELTARHTALLEAIIREKPAFWLWQHKRWKHTKNVPTQTIEP
ncbi:MAG TPA: lysophospholipid acyltransferase family protein [Candidatus Kapabacteria bacterium]|jgi:KDO2-lipid IV(A) lauroyltransferase